MKLKYQIDRETNKQPEALLDKAVSVLTNQDYVILERTESTLSFKDDNWQIRSKNKILSKVDQGKFEIAASKDGSRITLIYYVSFLPEFIITLILIIIGITQSYYVVIIAVPLLVQLFIRIDTLEASSNEMITRVIV
ncbi:hypothetical protein FBD94_14565 [Pedobacter hiemivivus]|uniref:Uncharacterized protein n=1 Tax=Pedobacter hiemivivus TaxID=2530454 RepID=A0A4V5PE62_9SPHI|nr:hypothetical protein [Pedobacter hiemivivus]TKC60136.1 hypothetical protein FBD94_14565 [Pedobacter hiemivivus]